MNLRYGIVSDSADVPAICQAGFDYLELRVTEVANPLAIDHQAFSQKRALLAGQPLPAECFCVLFPPTIKVVGPERDEERVHSYLDTALDRFHQLGCKVIVWGSGPARLVPEGFPRSEAWQQFKTTASYAADVCRQYDIVVALEPLQRRETNFLNLAGECLDMADELKRSNVGVTFDVDHWSKEEPDLTAAVHRAGSRILHVHLRDSNGGMPGTGGYDFSRVVALLREMRYAGRVSFETRGAFDVGLASARTYVHHLFAG
jgi:sugar phosphate isomerase/epimerase